MAEEKDKKNTRPPYPSSGQAKRALEIFRRITPKKIDSRFIVGNNLATPSNAFRILDLYKWLGIIDLKGNTNEEIVKKLRQVGEEKSRFMEELIKKSYSDLISSVNLKEAKKEDIINFFISNHNFSEIQSNFATALFLYLSKEYKVPLSKELREIAPSPEENKKYIPKKRGKKKQVYKIKEEAILEDKTEGEGILILIKGNDVNIKLSAKNREELKEIMDNKLPSILPTINLFLSEKKEEDEDEP